MSWTKDMRTNLNTKKCAVMLFGEGNVKEDEMDLMMGESRLQISKQEKDLGVVVDTSLKF